MGGLGGFDARGAPLGNAPLALVAAMLIALAALAGAAPGWAQEQALVLLDAREAKLVEADDGGWTVDVELANLTTDELTLTTQPDGEHGRGCRPRLDAAALPPAERLGVEVTVPGGCKLVDDAFSFEIDADPPDSRGGFSLASFPIVAALQEDGDGPSWGALAAFPILLVALGLLGTAWLVIEGLGPRKKLSSLDKSWSFKDSWVSNITIGAGLLTGIFGSSEVLTAMLGEEAEQSLALATVGAAVAAALIAAGPLILHGTKAGDGAGAEAGAFTVGGLLLAGGVTLAGAFGELWVVCVAASEIDLGGAESAVWPAGALAASVLALYAYRTTKATIDSGTQDATASTIRQAPPRAAAARSSAML